MSFSIQHKGFPTKWNQIEMLGQMPQMALSTWSAQEVLGL